MLIAARDGLSASIMEAARESLGTIAAGHGHFGVSPFNSFLVVHYVGNSSETARRMMVQCWSLLWPEMQARETTATSN
jgi:urease accessory protein